MPKFKKGQVWNKPKTALMEQFEKETKKNAVYRDKITGNFEYWQWQKEIKSKLHPKSSKKELRQRQETQKVPRSKPKPKPKTQKPAKLSTKWNKLSQKKRVALLTKEHDFDEYYAREVKRKIWNELPDQIKKDIKKYPNRIEDMSIINEELFEEYYGEKFDPDLIEKGDYVNFGPYGNMYVVFRVDEKRFWVTDLKDKRYDDNAPGWNIRVNYAKKIIRKG